MPSRPKLSTLSLIGAIALSTSAFSQEYFAPSAIQDVIGRARDGEDVLVRGQITGWVESDEVILQDATGTIVVELEERHLRIGLAMGARIQVLGEMDRDDGFEIDADWVAPDNGAPAFPVAPLAHVFAALSEGAIVAVQGEIRAVLDRDEIVLGDATGTMVVDLDDDHHLGLGLAPGEAVIVLARVDREGAFTPTKELDALVVRRVVRLAPAPVVVLPPVAVPAPAPAPVPAAEPAPPAVPAATEPPVPSIEERLGRLKTLRDSGLISDEDFAKRKEAILAEI